MRIVVMNGHMVEVMDWWLMIRPSRWHHDIITSRQSNRCSFWCIRVRGSSWTPAWQISLGNCTNSSPYASYTTFKPPQNLWQSLAQDNLHGLNGPCEGFSVSGIQCTSLNIVQWSWSIVSSLSNHIFHNPTSGPGHSSNWILCVTIYENVERFPGDLKSLCPGVTDILDIRNVPWFSARSTADRFLENVPRGLANIWMLDGTRQTSTEFGVHGISKQENNDNLRSAAAK
jgi:hypothetical protein